jgi:hypothetical protein
MARRGDRCRDWCYLRHCRHRRRCQARGDLSLERLERNHDPVPQTVECRTGGGGRHLYFAHPGGLIRNKVALAGGIDLRGDGGYVVAPPSMHSSGVRYEWIDGRSPGSAVLAPLPGWVLREAVEESPRRGHPRAYWRRLVSEGVPAGERNNTIASLAGHLLSHGVDAAVVWSCSCVGTVSAADRRWPTRRWQPWSRVSAASMSVTRKRGATRDNRVPSVSLLESQRY